jgi:geranylgeranyl diphosphate synthase type II
MQTFQQLASQFEAYLQQQTIFHKTPQNLYDPCEYFMGVGGKRVRPVLCLMGNEIIDEINPDAWHGAMSVELFHNFTLIHDDIMDNAPLRRGKTTIHEKYGTTAAILSGDVMAIYAYQTLCRISNNHSPTAIEVCEGQQMDMDFEQRNDVLIDEYIQMITLKTSVLLACSLKMGALIGGATANNADKLYEFGKNLGIAFQLQDDYLDAFGTSEKIGKQIGGDIKSNKKTYLLIKASEMASADQQKAISNLLETNNEDKIENMLALFEATGAKKSCEDAVLHYSTLAFQNLDEMAIVSTRKEPLYDLAAFLLNRQS